MKYFFMIIDYSIPLFMIFSYPWWKKIANGNISQYSGMRTTRSMENKENWKLPVLLLPIQKSFCLMNLQLV